MTGIEPAIAVTLARRAADHLYFRSRIFSVQQSVFPVLLQATANSSQAIALPAPTTDRPHATIHPCT